VGLAPNLYNFELSTRVFHWRRILQHALRELLIVQDQLLAGFVQGCPAIVARLLVGKLVLEIRLWIVLLLFWRVEHREWELRHAHFTLIDIRKH
jgi:hypothetical protein